MRVRRIKDTQEGTTRKRTIVWFGSYGADTNGNARFFNPKDKHDNFASGNTWVKDSLIQRLSVIKHELWYNYQYGMPLVDDGTVRVTIDAFVMDTVQSHEDVLEVTSFESSLDGHDYHCNISFTTRFGSETISL